MFDSIGFVGAGKLANALAVALSHAGYQVRSIASRSFISADRLSSQIEGCRPQINCQNVVDSCELVFITTPDDAIKETAYSLKWRPGQAAVHCSGADSSDCLECARDYGATVGVFHPLQTFAGGPDDPFVFKGITFCLEGSGNLLSFLKRIAADLGGNHIVLRPDDKVLYHAAAVISCNYMVTLASIAATLWSEFGIDKDHAITALLPLMRSTIKNIEKKGLPDCLTGPISRGDTGTLRKHIEALRKCESGLEKAYCELGKLTLPIASQKGKVNIQTISEIKKIFAEGMMS
jgi:predicted short-subunit dehydrogenase-like oxidoreductase (DUF2520 family)